MEQHPLSAAFPTMPQMSFDYLAKDIAENGLRLAITLYGGMVLDGWHRYKACQVAEVEPRFEQLAEDEDPVAFVRRQNLHRRDLTPSQRAAAVVACCKWAASGENQYTAGGGEPGSPPQTTTVTQMAEDADVSVRTIQRAKTAHVAGLGEQVRDGEITAKRAAGQARPRQQPARVGIKWSVVGPMLKAALEQIIDAEDRAAATEMAIHLLQQIDKRSKE